MSINKEIKTILVIGNGFDIAHGMKTKYTDFLDFIKHKISKHFERFIEKAANRSYKNLTPQDLEQRRQRLREFYSQYPAENRKHIDEKKLRGHIQRSLESGIYLEERVFTYICTFGNTWINHFNFIREDKIKSLGEDWVDFEQEIEYVIRTLEKLFRGEKINTEDLGYIINANPFPSVRIIIQNYIPILEWDLKILSLALEIYLSYEEEKLQSKPLPLIKNLPNVAYVISYNYTNTWQKIYGKGFPDVHPYFIHGQIHKHNLVFGIGETLLPTLENIYTECASFKKFFQRVKYRLGNDYKKISKNYYQYYKWQIIIYGHSLDATDKDSLRWLMGQEEKFDTELDTITIYYYDENSYNKQIANAIQIIGKKALMDAVHSDKLVFLPVKNSHKQI